MNPEADKPFSGPLQASGINILQLNLGYKCNMSCRHCHLEAGPWRTELMDRATIDASLKVLSDCNIGTVDLTGGAPELNPYLRELIIKTARSGRNVTVRSNLTVFYEPGMEDLPDFYSEYNVEIIASLPCYTETGADDARGKGTFSKSIAALKRLNSLGYGIVPEKKLNLVYNPMGAFLPSSQAELETRYKKELGMSFGIVFNCLYTFANMPVGRFSEFLVRSGNMATYMEKVKNAFNPGTLGNLMCRHLINVGWDGTLYDCDFNQALGIAVDKNCPRHIRDYDHAVLSGRKIVMGEHCFVCSAGQGST
ncbi:MAG: arsenosugar biosynthesis radical SAM protein ArsS [Nitrospirae bacterium]|nr:arsenosugar biosynthesis radical SAM protein ArsS [Nitrospirota bacterium]